MSNNNVWGIITAFFSLIFLICFAIWPKDDSWFVGNQIWAAASIVIISRKEK